MPYMIGVPTNAMYKPTQFRIKWSLNFHRGLLQLLSLERMCAHFLVLNSTVQDESEIEIENSHQSYEFKRRYVR